MSLNRIDQADQMLMDNKGRSRDLVLRLHEAGSTGLDLSPGDPLCREAAFELGRLRVELAGCEKVRDQWCKEFTEQRDDANALVRRCAALERALRAYGEHDASCKTHNKACTCGFTATLMLLATPQSKGDE